MLRKVIIPYQELEFQAVRSSGAGGQHVNKTSSAVQLRWHPASSMALTPEEKLRLLQNLSNRLSVDGLLQVRSDESRDQSTNKSNCIKKLHEIVEKNLLVPKKRKATKPTRGAVKRRLATKRTHSEKKRTRGEKF